MKRKENIEQFLLKSLIADLDVSQEQLDFDPIEEAKTATCSPKSLFNSSNDKCIETPYPCLALQSNRITSEEIFGSLDNQKLTLIIQSKVRSLSSNDLSFLLLELEGKLSSLMKNKNGNYLCSDLFKVCFPSQRVSMILEIESNIVDISIHQFGTHPIQTLIELAKTNEEIDLLLKAIANKDALVTLSKSANGSYVIQKIISNIPEQAKSAFNKVLLENLVVLSLDMYGVCIIKKYLTQSQSNLFYAIPTIISNFILISENQYGNYLIQYLLEVFWNRKEIIAIKHMIVNCFVILSSNRFSSHITEKYVSMLTSIEKQMLLATLISSGYSTALFNDKFGMYVMNKLSKGH